MATRRTKQELASLNLKLMERKDGPMFGMTIVVSDVFVRAIESFKSSHTDYVQLRMNSDNTEIIAIDQSTCTINELPGKVPEDEPRYHLFRYCHSHGDEFLSSIGKDLVDNEIFRKIHLKRMLIFSENTLS